MDFISSTLLDYCEKHSDDESELLKALSAETWQKVINPRMLSGHLQGRFLSLLSQLIQPKRILEIGTFTGYSALCLADGLQEDGELITIDENDELSWLHDKYFLQHKNGSQIKPIYNAALSAFEDLEGTFDLVFIDADKRNYLHYWNWTMEHAHAGTVILIDNVLWSGKVLEPAVEKDFDTQVLQELNDLVAKDSRCEKVLLPLRDGLMMVRVKK